MSSPTLKNAQKLRELNAQIKETFQLDPHDPTHQAATQAFHQAYDSLAFPGGISQALDRLKNKDPSILDEILSFLQDNPDYFRSGYHKEKMLQHLKSFSLSKKQQTLLSSLILRSIDGGPKRLFQAYSRLAPKITPDLLLPEVLERLHSPNPEIQHRATHVKEPIKQITKS